MKNIEQRQEGDWKEDTEMTETGRKLAHRQSAETGMRLEQWAGKGFKQTETGRRLESGHREAWNNRGKRLEHGHAEVLNRLRQEGSWNRSMEKR
jgi:hypothetical protein